MSTKFLRSMRECAHNVSRASLRAPASTDQSLLDLAKLEDRTLFSATPLAALNVDSVEDAPDTEIDLNERFSLDDAGGAIDYQVVSNSNSNLFANVTLNDFGQLVLDYAENAFGVADLVIEGTDGSGLIEQLQIHVDLESVNDSPTSIALQSVTTTDLDAGQTVIDLFAAFDDIEDADEDLTFELVSNSNSDLFESMTIDMERGLMILQHAAGQVGTAELMISATDTGHLTVGMGTPDGFRVFDSLGGVDANWPDTVNDLGLSQIKLVTSWWFFELGDDGYQFDTFSPRKLIRFFDTYDGDPNVPIVFDIENEYYTNTPEGRDRFAEVFALANELRPDLEIGLYRFAPERSWSAPVGLERAELDIATGLATGYAADLELYQQRYEDWLWRNELYRTEEVSAEFGGTPLGDMLDSLNPSLYTFKRDDTHQPTAWNAVNFDASTDTFTLTDAPSFDTIDTLRLRTTTDGLLSNGMSAYTNYFVINADGQQFQLSETEDGPAIDFTDEYTGDLHVAALGPFVDLWLDPDVLSWTEYAEHNIAEARKFGDKPVYAWLSPSIKAVSAEFIDGDFFRHQLEVMRPLADGVALYDPAWHTGEFHENLGWYTALRDFMATLDTPASTVSIELTSDVSTPTDTPPTDTPPANTPPANTPPIAREDSLTTQEDESLTIHAATLLANDFDANGESMQVVIGDGPTHGTLNDLGDGQWTYTPVANYHGADLFTYRTFDGTDHSELTTVAIDVRSVNDAPQAEGDEFWAVEDHSLSLQVSRLTSNDTDTDGQSLSFSLKSGPANGSLTLNAGGSLYYRSDWNFSGVDQFTYEVSDGIEVSEATVSINVISRNDRPIAVADRFEMNAGEALLITESQLLANDVDVEGDTLTVEILGDPSHGTFRQLDSGGFEYVPDNGFVGADQIAYRITDGELESTTTVLEVFVNPVINREPEASPDTLTTVEDSPLVFTVADLIANDRDRDGDNLDIELVDSPTHGSIRWTQDGRLVYVPEANFSGADRFGYRLNDGATRSEVVAVIVHVTPENDAPVAKSELYRVNAGSSIEVGGSGVLANDYDVEGDALQVMLAQSARHGKVQLMSDGSFTYEANRGFSGTDRFSYRVTDEHGASSIATAVIRVQAVAIPVATITPFFEPEPEASALIRDSAQVINIRDEDYEKPPAFVP